MLQHTSSCDGRRNSTFLISCFELCGSGMKHPLWEPKSGTPDDWDKSSLRPVLTYTAHATSMQLLFADRTSLPIELSVIECFETDGGVNYRSDRLI
jgi:hypothetical protein